jgi:hypothetical protein
LDELASNYRSPKTVERYVGKIAISELELAKALADAARRIGSRLVMTGAASAPNYAVMAREPVVTAYCRTAPRELVSALGAKFEETDRFPNIDLTRTEEGPPYFDVVTEEGVEYSSPVQSYLELMSSDKRQRETAEQVRAYVLRRTRELSWGTKGADAFQFASGCSRPRDHPDKLFIANVNGFDPPQRARAFCEQNGCRWIDEGIDWFILLMPLTNTGFLLEFRQQIGQFSGYPPIRAWSFALAQEVHGAKLTVTCCNSAAMGNRSSVGQSSGFLIRRSVGVSAESVNTSEPAEKSLSLGLSVNPQNDADFQAVAAAWPTLPTAIRAGIVAMIQAAKTSA